jgi:formate--tetrahydrofolate ligase
VHGAMAVMLKSALAPNLVQTLEHTPALIHGGPFANIAHGCNSVLATSAALRMADYVVTEAGFGADLGAEKFVNIKCRKSGLKPSAAVIVATIRALKYHGGVGLDEIAKENLSALTVGIANLERHIDNVRNQYGLPCVVAVNCFDSDTPAEIKLLQHMLAPKVSVVCASHWLHGGQGAEELARHVLTLVEGKPADLRFSYEDEAPLWDKMNSIATSLYGASGITATTSLRRRISQLEEDGYRHYPICTAKTQYSFSTDPKLRGAPEGHVVNVREVRLAAGAEFIVMICGDVMTMPGMPKVPAAERIDLADDGSIVGLF